MLLVDRLVSWFKSVTTEKEDDLLKTVEGEIVASTEDTGAIPATQAPPAPAGEKEVNIDQFFIKMSGVEAKSDIEIKDVLSPSVPAVPQVEKVKEPEKPAGDTGKNDGGLMDSLFQADEGEENSAIAALIASIPDVTMDEVLKDISDVRALMLELAGKQRGNGRKEST